MAKKKVDVKKHPRTLESGKVVKVKKHKREIEKVEITKDMKHDIKSGKSKPLKVDYYFLENVIENPKLKSYREYKGIHLEYISTTSQLNSAKAKIKVLRNKGLKSYYFIGSIKGVTVYRIYKQIGEMVKDKVYNLDIQQLADLYNIPVDKMDKLMKEMESEGYDTSSTSKINDYINYGIGVPKLEIKTEIKGSTSSNNKIQRIEHDYKEFNNMSKEALVKCAMNISKLDVSHIKSQSKSTIIGYLMQKKYSIKDLESYENQSNDKKNKLSKTSPSSKPKKKMKTNAQLAKEKQKKVFDDYYKKTGAEVYRLVVMVEKNDEHIIDELIEKAKKQGFKPNKHNLSEIDHETYGYQIDFDTKQKPMSYQIINKMENLIKPYKKKDVIYDTHIRYKTENTDDYFHGSNKKGIEEQIKSKTN